MNKNVFKMRIKKAFYFLKRGFKKFGKHSILDKPLAIKGKKYISIGNNVTILKNSRIECFDHYLNESYKPELVIEEKVTIQYNFTALIASKCYIGKNTLIASNVLISTENHGMNPNESYAAQGLIAKDVVIGENCWIGEKVVILPGVHIGKNVIIGAASVVTKDIPDNCIAVGNPAKTVKRYNFELNLWEKIIEA